MIAHQRVIPLNSSTAVVIRSDVNALDGFVTSTADTTHFVANNVGGISAVDNSYNGIYGYFRLGPGAGRDFLVTDYVGATRTFTITPAYVTAPTAATTFSLGPALPGRFSEIAFGNAAGTVYYSFTPGGALDATLRLQLIGGMIRTFDHWTAGAIDYIEFVSANATDTIDFEWV